jgi:hypothetical protein
MDRQEVRDHAQEIAVREAGQIARWQQVQAFADAIIAAARRYINQALPVPRSSYQNAADRSDAYSEVEHLLLRTIVAIRFPRTDVDNVSTDHLVRVARDMYEGYERMMQRQVEQSAKSLPQKQDEQCTRTSEPSVASQASILDLL